jgi:hypothetical protein
LDEALRLSVWDGFSFDKPDMIDRLEMAIATFQPKVVYLDALCKLTLRDLNRADEASAVLAICDGLRRKYGVIFRMLHHYRKGSGFRTGRGSQEIGGSYVLGAWGENSLFFEPIGRKQGAVRVHVQSKDRPPQAPFGLSITSEGPTEEPTLIRLVAADTPTGPPSEARTELVFQAVATLDKQVGVAGKEGVSVSAIRKYLKLRSDKPARKGLEELEKEGRVSVADRTKHGAKLWAVAQS